MSTWVTWCQICHADVDHTQEFSTETECNHWAIEHMRTTSHHQFVVGVVDHDLSLIVDLIVSINAREDGAGA